MTDSQRRGLEVLRDSGPLTPSQFAKKMWPNSPAWRKCGKCGPNGSHAGVAMPSAGGAMIARLRRLGWVTWALKTMGHYSRHELTQAGREALAKEKLLTTEPELR